MTSGPTTRDAHRPAVPEPEEQLHLAATVARRYYLDRVSRTDIAQELGVSRFKVARLLDRASAEGLVRIEVFDPLGVDAGLSDALRDALGLRRAMVLAAADRPRVQVGALAARYLAEVLPRGGRVGIAWSRATQALVEHLPGRPPCRFVQLCGVIPRTAEEEHDVELVRRAARAVGGSALIFYAPFVADRAATATALRRHPGIAEALRECDHLDVAVVTVGAWRAGESTVHDALPVQEQQLFRRRGAVAESCGMLLAEDGRLLRDGLQRRVVAVDAGQLRRTPEVVALATDENRTSAVRAVARSGLVHTLVTHRAVAEQLLREPPEG
jgi:DNA-binding transcriptional regulator LsrR (DeoR family)